MDVAYDMMPMVAKGNMAEAAGAIRPMAAVPAIAQQPNVRTKNQANPGARVQGDI